ncbi:MAG: hypothetical protein ABII18_12090 [bacterium]
MTLINGLADNVFHQVADAGGSGAATTGTPPETDEAEKKADKPGYQNGFVIDVALAGENVSPYIIRTEATSIPDYRWVGQGAKLGFNGQLQAGHAWATGANKHGLVRLLAGLNYTYSPYRLDYNPLSNNTEDAPSQSDQDSTTRLQAHRIAGQVYVDYLTRMNKSADAVVGGHASVSIGGIHYANTQDQLFISDRQHTYSMTGEGRPLSPWSIEFTAGGDIGHANVRAFIEGYVRLNVASAPMNVLGESRPYFLGDDGLSMPANAISDDAGALAFGPEAGLVEGGLRVGIRFGTTPKAIEPTEAKEPEPKTPEETRPGR